MIAEKPIRRTSFALACLSAALMLASSGCAVTKVQPAPQTEWHVAPTGSDSAAGTKNAPFATLQKALTVVQPGETVVVHAGTYTLTAPAMLSNKASTADKPITIKGEGRPVFKGQDFLDIPVWEGLIGIEKSPHVTLKGLRFENSGWFGIKVSDSDHVTVEDNEVSVSLASAIYVERSPEVKVLKNDVSRFCDQMEKVRGSTCQEGISIVKTDGFEVAWNKVHDALQGAGTNPGGGEGIDAKEGSKNGTIHHNHVYNLVQLGIYVDSWNLLTENIDVYSNIVHNTAHGIAVASENGGTSRNIRIFNNLVYNAGYHGITVAKAGTDGSKQDVSIFNNTVYGNGYTEFKPPWCKNWGCDSWGYGIVIESGNISNIKIQDNIVVNNHSASISTKDVPADKFTINTNVLFPKSPFDWYGENQGLNVIEKDPLFVDAAKGDFHLKATSPAIAAGLGGMNLTTDLDDKTRPAGKVDIGAYAYLP